jgi:hypothetical protein
MPWIRLKSGTPFHVAKLQPGDHEIPEPGSEPVDPAPVSEAEDPKPKKAAKKK